MSKSIGAIWIIGCMLLMICAACSGPAAPPDRSSNPIETATPGAQIVATEAKSIGSISRETDVVEHGRELAELVRLLDPVGLFAGDIVQVHEGGEGLLDFGDQLRLRLFNDSRLAVLQMASAPDAPLDVRMFLEEGGFTGELAKSGSRAQFKTPGGAEITILGTQFEVVYDPATKVTTVVNFGGTVEVAGGGQSVALSSGYYLTVPDGQSPSAQLPIKMSLAEFKQRARELKSPIGAAHELTQWTLTITHELNQKDAFGEIRHLMIWSGSFTVIDDEIIGNGVGRVSGHHRCGDSREPEYDVAGEFTFQITGEQKIAQSDGRTLFRIVIDGKDLNLHSGAKCQANFYENTIAAPLRKLAEQLPSLVKHIEIEARDGSGTTVKLPDSLAVFSATPLEVELKSSPPNKR